MGQFVAHNAAGDALHVGEQVIHGFDFSFGAARGELRARAFDQVVEISLRVAQRFAVGVFSFATDVEVGIESLLEGEYLDLKFFFDQQTQGALGGLGARRIGIEVHYDVLAETA